MKLYNPLEQKLEVFEPRGQAVSIYVCGITPYDTTHLGHAFTFTSFDIIIRYLESKGHRVLYVQNVTDIDDDILRQAKKEGKDWQVLGDRWTAHYIQDMQALNVRPPDFFPRATDYVADMVETVQQLIEAGVAYESGGNVYFHIDSWPRFGELSRIPRDEMLAVANERGNFPDDPNKRDPLDFVLWQAQAPGEPAWESPWGLGRPGWHIECSTMSSELLGGTVDIHGGGADLVFPHHESEIAQSEGAAGHEPFVRFWMHTAMVYYQGEKMSKSLGNLIMVRDMLEDWSPDALRLYMARHHYREPWPHDDEELATAEQLAQKLRLAISATGDTGPSLDPATAQTVFTNALEDDLFTPRAVRVLEQLTDATLEAADAGQDISAAQAVLREMGHVLGLRLDQPGPEPRVIEGWGRHLQRFSRS
jgi:L-cysteine:1D-myo-inositol 2-amino-2-deoxy-alpha-D-glucopyranoside ligase